MHMDLHFAPLESWRVYIWMQRNLFSVLGSLKSSSQTCMFYIWVYRQNYLNELYASKFKAVSQFTHEPTIRLRIKFYK